MPFYESFLSLCAKEGITPSAAAEAVGLSRSSVNGWKNGKMPRESTLERIAQLFNTSLEVVKGLETQENTEMNKSNLTTPESELSFLKTQNAALKGQVDKLNAIIEEKQKMIDLLANLISMERKRDG